MEAIREKSGWGVLFIYAGLSAFFVILIGVLSDTGTGIVNSDDIMRLVTVRDLRAGQNWFDPVQYRLGLEGGTLMHWSRLVDAPIAALYWLGLNITSDIGNAEQFALIAWPAITLFCALLGLVFAAKRIDMSAMYGPISIIGVICFLTIGVFNKGALDHHNIQIVLAIWMIALLLPSKSPNDDVVPYAFAGLMAVAMLAIGMETLPYVTVGCAWVAFAYMIGVVSPNAARSFGFSIALSSLVIFAGTVSPGQYLAAYCDAYSFFHIVMCGLGGLGLGLTAHLAHSFKTRLIGLAMTGVLCAGALLVLFPECLANPLSSLDPKLRTFWLEGVIETRSLADLWQQDRFQIFGIFGMGCAGLVAGFFLLVQSDRVMRQRAVLLILMLIAALGVTIWQQRGTMFAASFAIFPLSILVTHLRRTYTQTNSTGDLLKMAFVGVLSLNLFWWTLGSQATKLFASGPTLLERAASASSSDYCFADSVFDDLAKEPKGVVLGATDIGALTLKNTHHRVLAGPYHRNIDGNLHMIETMLAPPDKAKQMLEKANITLIADCIKSADAADFKKAEPQGLQAQLHNGIIPKWLEIVPETAQKPLVIYRFKP